VDNSLTIAITAVTARTVTIILI